MYFLYFYHVCFYSFMCSYHVPSIRLCMTSIYSFHLFINNLRIYYLLYYSFICIYYLLMYSLFRIHYSFIQYLLFKYVFVYVFTIHNTIHLYVFYYSLTCTLLFIYTYFTIHLYVFYYSLMYSLFTIYHLPFTINYLLLTIYYLGENPYLMEFDETPIFWYSRVARDVWINLTFYSDQF